ncbi:Hypothetical predicted protein, partial [Pelobates cultripes]
MGGFWNIGGNVTSLKQVLHSLFWRLQHQTYQVYGPGFGADTEHQEETRYKTWSKGAHLLGPNAQDWEVELYKFGRSLRLKDFFKSKTVEGSEQSHQFRVRSTFDPLPNQPSIKSFLRSVQKETTDHLKGKHQYHSNCTMKDRAIIKSLALDKNIVIRPADKGGGIVIQNYSDYRLEILSQLSDQTTYDKLSIDPTKEEPIEHLSTCIKDTPSFVKLLSRTTLPSESVVLVTCDVSSLYTVIPHQEGIEAMRSILSSSLYYTGPPIEFILELLEIVLSQNYFRFEMEWFRQIAGTSMGAAMAPMYANGYMYCYETKHILEPYKDYILQYVRYIDDIFMVFK